LVCKNIQIGNPEDNINKNPGDDLKPPFSSQYFRVSNLNLFIGDSSEGKTKSTVYIADNRFTIFQGGSGYSFFTFSYFE
jgi:hypothetical protein